MQSPQASLQPTFPCIQRSQNSSQWHLTKSRITRARRRRIRPPSQPVRQIRNITRRRTRRLAQVPSLGDKTTIVAARRRVGAVVVDEILHKAVAGGGALRAVLDHVPDGLIGVLSVEFGAVVGLHDAWVGDAVVGGFYAGTAGGLGYVSMLLVRSLCVGDTYLLQDCGKDEPVVHEGCGCAVLDCVVNGLDHFGAGSCQSGETSQPQRSLAHLLFLPCLFTLQEVWIECRLPDQRFSNEIHFVWSGKLLALPE